MNDYHDSHNPRQSVGRCGCGSIVGYNAETGVRLLIPMRCKSWLCDRCRPSKAAQAIDQFIRGDPERFITLTVDAKAYEDPTHALRTMKNAWHLLVEQIRRAYGNFEYSLVWELTKAGWPHLHAAARGCYIPQRWLARVWRELTESSIVHITKIKSAKHCAKYLAKYLLKDPARTVALLGHANLIQRSRNYLLRERSPSPHLDASTYAWSWSPQSVPELIAEYEEQGYRSDPRDDVSPCVVLYPNASPWSEDADIYLYPGNYPLCSPRQEDLREEKQGSLEKRVC